MVWNNSERWPRKLAAGQPPSLKTSDRHSLSFLKFWRQLRHCVAGSSAIFQKKKLDQNWQICGGRGLRLDLPPWPDLPEFTLQIMTTWGLPNPHWPKSLVRTRSSALQGRCDLFSAHNTVILWPWSRSWRIVKAVEHLKKSKSFL